MNFPSHLYEIQQLSTEQLERVFDLARSMEERPLHYQSTLAGIRVATLFYEPSTRTRLSFETAALSLGAGVISTENAREFSSAAKGETLEDTVRVIGTYAHVLVLRYDLAGGVELAARYAPVPVINAGDGTGQHPTQALLDMYTILKHNPDFRGKKVVLVGDLGNGRTVHSLAYLIAKHFPENELILVSPDIEKVKMPARILDYLTQKRVKWSESSELDAVLSGADVVYMTRVQSERFKESTELFARVLLASEPLILTPERVAMMKPNAIILHPLPRLKELPPEVDADPRAKYFEQVWNGVPIRMALLALILGRA